MSNNNDFRDDPLPSNELFPNGMRRIQLDHAHRILVYLVRRPDNNIQAPNVESLLRRHRQVNDEYLKLFYQNLSGLVHALQRYLSLEESCTMSGAYKRDLDTARTRVGKILDQFENEKDGKTLRFLTGMIG